MRTSGFSALGERLRHNYPLPILVENPHASKQATLTAYTHDQGVEYGISAPVSIDESKHRFYRAVRGLNDPDTVRLLREHFNCLRVDGLEQIASMSVSFAHPMEGCAHVKDAYTAKDYRGRGIMSELYRRASQDLTQSCGLTLMPNPLKQGMTRYWQDVAPGAYRLNEMLIAPLTLRPIKPGSLNP